MEQPVFKRVLLKLSGEALLGERSYGIDTNVVQRVAREIVESVNMGVEMACVIGGGNIFRGVAGAVKGMDRASADYMGMLATVINGLALQDAIEKMGVPSRVVSGIGMKRVAEPFIRRRSIRHLEKKRVVIFVAGTGNPYFTTDTAAALRAKEIGAEVILKATKVDGVYSADPEKDKNALKYDETSYLDLLKNGLRVLDATAVSLCMENNLPIIVFNLLTHGNIKRVLLGEKVGTLVKGKDDV